MSKFKYSVGMWNASGIAIDSPKERLRELREIGFDGVEIPGVPEKMTDTKELRDALHSIDMEPVLVNGITGKFGVLLGTYPTKDITGSNPESRKAAVEYIEKCVDLAVDFDAPYVLVAQGPMEDIDPSETGVMKARNRFIEVAKKTLNYAKDRGIILGYEPQCRFEAYPGVMSTVEQSVNLLDELGMDNAGIVLDTFHANIEESSMTEAVKIAGKKLIHIHFMENNRCTPGLGTVNFREIVQTLVQTGYSGYLSLEFLVDQDIMSKSIDYLKSIERVVRIQTS